MRCKRSLQQNETIIETLFFFSSSLRTKIFLPYVCLNLLYSSSVNDFFFFLFSPSLKVTREMTLTDIFAFALVTAKQLRDVV